MSPKLCQEALNQISHMRITGRFILKILIYFRIYQLVNKIVLPLSQSCRVVSEGIFKSAMSEPVQMEKSITGVEDITEG